MGLKRPMSKTMHIGVLTSGGDSPGMNAAIRAVVRTAHFHGLGISGIHGGFNGSISGEVRPMGVRDVSNIIQLGGTILRSARSERFRTVEGRSEAAATLKEHGITALIVIGGDGTFTGARILSEEHGIPVVGLPGTIDNDLFGTDRTIGYDTATNTAVSAIDKIRDTASSHDRLFFVEVMGRDTGFIALDCAIAAGAEFAMVPEKPQSIDELIEVLRTNSRSKSSSIVIVAEGDEEGGAFTVARRVKEKFDHFDTRVSVLGHMQRGGSPSVLDRILASRTGVAAVEALIRGENGVMVGMESDRITLTPFKVAIETPRRLNDNMMRDLSILAI